MFIMAKLEQTALDVKAVSGGKEARKRCVREGLPRIVFPERF